MKHSWKDDRRLGAVMGAAVLSIAQTFFLSGTALAADPVADSRAGQPSLLVDKLVSKASPVAWPDPLVMLDGQPVRDVASFEGRRKPEIRKLFEDEMYGRTPEKAIPVHYSVTSEGDALGGKAIRREVTITLGGEKLTRDIHLLILMPKSAKGPMPVMVGLNFFGNQAITADAGVALNDVWVVDPALADTPIATELAGHVRVKADDSMRGKETMWWDADQIVSRGYALATAYAGDIEPDFAAGIGYGVRPLFIDPASMLPGSREWGALGAWGWGMSRILDYVETDPTFDRAKEIAFGFSRMGKAALWASAQDDRFDLTISSESGQGGVTLSHRQVDEPIAHMNIAFPYWLAPSYHRYTDHADELPVDGHLLLALIAPRPVYIGSAEEDPYSDPAGEFLSAVAARPVYALYGKVGLGTETLPPLSTSIGETIGFHLRPGGHATTPYDWRQYLNFADKTFGKGK